MRAKSEGAMDEGPTEFRRIRDETKEDEKLTGAKRERGKERARIKAAPGKKHRVVLPIFARRFRLLPFVCRLHHLSYHTDRLWSSVCCSPLPCTTWSAVIHTELWAVEELWEYSVSSFPHPSPFKGRCEAHYSVEEESTLVCIEAKKKAI